MLCKDANALMFQSSFIWIIPESPTTASPAPRRSLFQSSFIWIIPESDIEKTTNLTGKLVSILLHLDHSRKHR